MAADPWLLIPCTIHHNLVSSAGSCQFLPVLILGLEPFARIRTCADVCLISIMCTALNHCHAGVCQFCEAAKRLGVPLPMSIHNDFSPVLMPCASHHNLYRLQLPAGF
jgi:hypothetical protein